MKDRPQEIIYGLGSFIWISLVLLGTVLFIKWLSPPTAQLRQGTTTEITKSQPGIGDRTSEYEMWRGAKY